MDSHLKHTPYSDPGDPDISGLPRDPGELARLVRGLIIHRGEGERLRHEIPRQRLHHDAESRYVSELLRILRERSDRPLTEPRAYGERFVGTCRDFALLHVSLLRATGTPARVRGGFATYFLDGFHEDHWVTEYRLPDGSWRLADPQVLHPGYDLDFDPLDVPRNRFLVAGDAWRACREGRADPATFGVSWLDRIRGLWYVRFAVLHDLAALNGVEVLPWDGWGPEILDDASLTGEDLALADAVARADDEADLRRLYAHPRLTVPDAVTSYTTYGGVRQVILRRASPGGSRAATRSA
ncbi:transglutaminase domain-containing protein [Streptomyces sp. NBC_00285]|uniref:transglutaminase-like domain-containing protein n=1 Tax=Streptomyces sp. NBC_00285 TaxID=2975700 RepID=UPI002E2B441B|nr:transglutaminase domain-containing protein [Streptomyces sp. NBC_00285]